MNIRITFFILTLFVSITLFGQRKNDKELLKSNRIEIVFTQSFDIENGKISKDSTLTVTRKYNRLGNATHTILHDSLGSPDITYEYLYDNFGQRYIGRNVFAHPHYILISSTTTRYNKKGQPIKHFDTRYGGKKSLSAKRLYNKKDQLTSIEFYRYNKRRATQSYGYNSAGKLNSSVLTVHDKSPVNKSMLLDDELISTYVQMSDGHENFTFEEAFNNDQSVKVFTFFANEEIRLLGADGMIDLSKGDTLRIQLNYQENGLLKNKTQFINDELNAFVKFYYGIFIDK